MSSEDLSDPLRGLQILQRDLAAFTESRLSNIERLTTQLDASTEDLKVLLERNRRSDASRNKLLATTSSQLSTITVDEVEYQIGDEFRESALQVAEQLDLDEIEAAKLCIESQVKGAGVPTAKVLCMRAVLRFHERRQILLDCLRILLLLGVDSDSDEDHADAFRATARVLIQGEGGGHSERSAYWDKCLDGLLDIETFLKKVLRYKDVLAATGMGMSDDDNDYLVAQRLLLTRQHEHITAILTYLIRGDYAQSENFQRLLSHAASLEADFDITTHYLPILISGSAYFASDHTTTPEVAHQLHSLLAPGPQQLPWKQTNLKSVATVCWLAEYSARFSTTSIDLNQTEASRALEEEGRSKLFFSALKDKAFHFMLAAAASLRPVVWHDPARTGIIDFLLDFAVVISSDAPRPSDTFSAMAMRELQAFAEAFVTNMPDTLRLLKVEEDDMRRTLISQTPDNPQTNLDLERFMVIMACAYQNDGDAANDFWSDKESHHYGFLRWVSQRLPTPRVAAFCQLLQSIACDDKSANQAHRFLLEDSNMTSGKLRKSCAVSWSQIFSELELYATTLKDRPVPHSTSTQDHNNGQLRLEEPETGIMLDAYLGLAAHVCQMSPDARNWLLKDQTFHLGEVMFQLARSAHSSRLQACSLDMLAALLTDKTLEVRNGIWVLLDSWVALGGLNGSSLPTQSGRPQYSAKDYLRIYARNAEAGASMIALLNALVAPKGDSPESRLDALPFPENLGVPHRRAGIDAYVDFVMDSVFARKVPRMPVEGEASLLNLVRFQCLQFAYQCLSSFNEDLVVLANTTNVSTESAMETKSLATYCRLHPFARVMEWLFDKAVLSSLFAALQQNVDALNDADADSPLVQATLKSAQVLSLAWKLQATYFDLVRPVILSQPQKAAPSVSPAWESVDGIFLSHLHAVPEIAQITVCRHVDLSLVCLGLLHQIGSSRKLSQTTDLREHGRQHGRLTGLLMPVSAALTLEMSQDFLLHPWDLEVSEIPTKLMKANAILNLLSANLDASNGRPSMALGLLGFHCREHDVTILPESAFAHADSLFHAISSSAATSPVITENGFTSWLLTFKRGCMEVVLKLASSPLTASIVQSELRSMEFLAALSRNQAPVTAHPFWNGNPVQDDRPLLDESSIAIRDFIHVREKYFEIAAVHLRAAAEEGSFSSQERIVGALLGTVQISAVEHERTTSVFDLFDFFDLKIPDAFVVPKTVFFDDVNLSSCTKDNPDTFTAFDINMAEGLLILRRRELKENGTIKDTSEAETAENEIRAILAALISQNNFASIQSACLDALESWTDLLSLVIMKANLTHEDVVALSLQGLLVVLPQFERALSDNLEAAALLAKLTLTFTYAISPASNDSIEQAASAAVERLLSTFRVSLRAITDSSTDLALRDVSYRTCCAILASIPRAWTESRATPIASARQLTQLVQSTGERLLSVVTEDAFSGRGVTRVSALLFLDGLVSLSQGTKANLSMLKGLLKLNFLPVLIDTSIGSISGVFMSQDETVTTLAYFHTALALLLRLCQSPEGTQLVLNSSLMTAIDDSMLFTTDPDVGLDIDNPVALQAFYAILADILRLLTLVVVQRGAQPGRTFLVKYRFIVQAIFKQASRGHALKVADELSKLILATGFLEDDVAASGAAATNGFS